MDFSTLDQPLRDYLAATPLPGFSLAISDRDQTLHTFTYSSDRVPNPPITPDTLFEVGSIGKSFTSILFQQLVDAGKYDLHVPVTNYLPWFEVQTDYEPITTHHLLGHTAGIINGTETSDDALGEVYGLRDTVTGSPPGTFFHYSNAGYKLLGLVLEHVTGRSYADLLQEQIFDPLGLTDTYPAVVHGLRPKMAVGYVPLYTDRPPPIDHPIVPANWLETGNAAGCIVATASDLAKYMRMLMNEGYEGVLSNEGYKRMIHSTMKIGDHLHYGYGLATTDTPDGQFIQHSGGMIGYVTQMTWHVESGYGFTAMSNNIAIPGMDGVIKWLEKALLALDNPTDFPVLDAPENPFVVDNAEDYAGIYIEGDTTLTIVTDGTDLILKYDDADLPLGVHTPDHFICDHADFERFAFSFQRDENEAITSIAHGERLYLVTGGKSQQNDYPEEWEAYRGHYRNYNPWLPAFRILLRDGKLYWQCQFWNVERPLIPLDDGSFRVGEDEQLPERLRFDQIVDGYAIRARYDTDSYYRTFTP